MTATGGHAWDSFSFKSADYSDGTDPISRVACRITLKFEHRSSQTGGFLEEKDRPASGFLLWHRNTRFLVTNWHCLTGRNSFTGKPVDCKDGALPSHVVVDLSHLGLHDPRPRPLFDAAGDPLWLQHPDRDTEIADLVALPLSGLPDDTPALFKPGFAVDRTGAPLPLSVGEDVFLVGFPKAVGNGAWPVWKHASLASEPAHRLRLANHAGPLRAVLVDGAFMDGLSGSLAIRKAAFPNLLSSKGLTRPLWHDREGTPFWYSLVGVYSGRAKPPKVEKAGCAPKDGKASDEDVLAQASLGIVWGAELLHEIVDRGVRGAPSP